MKTTSASSLPAAVPPEIQTSPPNPRTPQVSVPLKPPLKWAGGKRWLVPQLRTIWQEHKHRRYVEPFCGGLAMALGLNPGCPLLNDINPHLINFYRQVQRGLKAGIDMRNNETLFYANRNRFNALIQQGQPLTPEAAQLFYYLNRTCFNGLCRFNRGGEFNVPFGSYRKISYANDFHGYRETFKNWSFTNLDLKDLPLERDDFVYADPPYDVEFTTYSANGFVWEDQLRTAEFLAAHAGPVILSNQATPRIVSLYQKLGFQISFLSGPRRISCTGDRTAAEEVLAIKAGH